jgi:hypothetical protein
MARCSYIPLYLRKKNSWHFLGIQQLFWHFLLDITTASSLIQKPYRCIMGPHYSDKNGRWSSIIKSERKGILWFVKFAASAQYWKEWYRFLCSAQRNPSSIIQKFKVLWFWIFLFKNKKRFFNTKTFKSFKIDPVSPLVFLRKISKYPLKKFVP